MDDTFRSILKTSEGLYKEKGSRFIAYAYPVGTEDEIKEILKQVKKEHHSARHHCYAWRLGYDGNSFRANDDGEPSSSAGKPILGVITSENLTNILVVVVRYFGGILLGVSGLINAYRSAASDAIRNAEITTGKIRIFYKLEFGYPLLNEVMQLLKSGNVEVVNLKMEESCEAVIAPLRSEATRVKNIFSDIYGVEISDIQG